MEETQDELNITPEVERLRLYKESAFNWRQRRHQNWTENYTLYRDKVIVNRLTQRQSVNIPLMKQVIKSLLKDVDEPPMLYLENLDNDKQKELFYNEYWEMSADRNKLILKDIVDKKQVFLYGRSFKKLNIVNGRFYFEINDPQDILVDRYIDPSDLDSARYLIHVGIFRPLSSIEANGAYDKQELLKLKEFYATQAGLIKASENSQAFQEKNDRMRRMGVPDVDNPILGETYVEINEFFVKERDEAKGKDVIQLYTVADEMVTLAKRPLDEVLGKTTDDFWQEHYPYTSWADDTERTDFWSDGVGDTIRTPNHVLNSWFSQLVENRTLRNFGMHYYNSSTEGFTPQTFEPVPWGWYPVPGNPNEVLKKVDIPDLSESLDKMNFLIEISEKATAATATQQGAITERQVTLGEIQLTLAEAKERINSMAVFYNESWKEFGTKYVKLLEGAHDKIDAVKLFKKGYDGNMFSKEVKADDWKTKSGYRCKIMSKAEKEARDMQGIQKLNAVMGAMPDNQALKDIYNKKLLEFADLKQDEIKQVLDFEKQKMEALPSPQPTLNGGVEGAIMPQQPQPVPQQIPA